MIYFIQAGEDGPIKIGFATDAGRVRERLRLFQTSHHETLMLLGVAEGTREQEGLLHQMFAGIKVRGEWFEPHPDLKVLASEPFEVRRLLDLHGALRRWRRWGLLAEGDALSEGGVDYLLALEAAAVEKRAFYFEDLEDLWWLSFASDSPARPQKYEGWPEAEVA